MTKAEVWIPLTQGKVAVIDFEDFEKVRGIKWRAAKGLGHVWYAQRSKWLPDIKKYTTIGLHQFIWGEDNVPEGFEIAHTDGDGLNCRRGNLKCCTHAQNLQGRQAKRSSCSSGHRGVSWNTRDRVWRAQLKKNTKVFYLGSFDDEIEAARAYDAAAINFFGEYASPNFPREIVNVA